MYSYIKESVEDYVINTIVAITMAIAFFLCAYPFFYAIILSFNDGIDAMRGGIYAWPRQFTLDNYVSIFTDDRWIMGFAVSIARTLLGTVITTLFTSIVAYGLSYKELMFRKLYMKIIVFCMYFNGGLIPYYIVLKQLRLVNNFFVYIIPQALNLFYVIVAISFFQAIPAELSESAKLDGANETSILARIIFPLSLPLLATIAIFSGVAHWSSWFDSAFFIQNNRLRTLGYLLMEVIKKSNVNSGATSAAAQSAVNVTPLSMQTTAMVIAVTPIMLIYPFMQKYFITGLTMGSVKG